MERCVSVIIPSFNRAHLLTQTIPSYIQKNVGEVIFVDDCSTDNTADVIEHLQKMYPIIKYVRMGHNSKQMAAKNKGIEYARYPYVYFGDDDSFITSETISELLETMKQYAADVVGAKALYMDTLDDMKDITHFIQRKSRKVLCASDVLNINRFFYINFDFDCVTEQVPFCHACALCRRDIFKNIHFDTRYGGNAFREETDLFTRVSAAGYKIVYDSKAVQINLPRKMILQKNSFLKYKIRSSYYEFLNTYKYLKRNELFLKKYYKFNYSIFWIWLKYMKDALQMKALKFLSLLVGNS